MSCRRSSECRRLRGIFFCEFKVNTQSGASDKRSEGVRSSGRVVCWRGEDEKTDPGGELRIGSSVCELNLVVVGAKGGLNRENDETKRG